MYYARVIFAALSLVTWSAAAAADEEPPKEPPKEEDKQASAQAGATPKVDDAREQQEKELDPGAKSPARSESEAQSAPPGRTDDDDPEDKKFTLGGYVETYYQWNFNQPSNGITDYRAYDNRHNTLTLQNVVLDAGFRAKDLSARLALQAGHTAAAMWSQETKLPGTSSTNETDDKLWRPLQRASVGWTPSKPLLLEAGLFTTAYGVEGFAVKDNWNWSRSYGFARLPNYQTGIKATVHLNRRWDVIGGVYNGWNNVVDNNDEKSFFIQGQYKLLEKLTASGTYLGGVEREGGAPEGRAWRHLVQAYVQWDALTWFDVGGEGDGGFENNHFGFHWFAGAAAYARAKAVEWLYFAFRGERLWEDPSANAEGQASTFLLPAKYVTAGTATIDVRPVKGLSTRLELRHDRASSDLFFRKQVEGEGTETSPYVANTTRQTTLLFGVTAWF